jgi:hypothetical protein
MAIAKPSDIDIERKMLAEEMRRYKVAAQGIANAAGSGTLTIDPTLWTRMPPPHPTWHSHPQGPGENVLYHADVKKAENGYILTVTHEAGQTPKVYVAKDADELRDVFITAIIAEKVSK